MADFTGFTFGTPAVEQETAEGGDANGFTFQIGAAQDSYVNRVWQTTNLNFVRWTTFGTPDPLGASYPGPGVFGVNTQTPASIERENE